MTAPDVIKAAAVLIAWHYGEAAGANGRNAMLFLLRNRANHQDYGTWRDAVNSVQPFTQAGLPDSRDPGFTSLLHNVESVYDGTARDRLTGGAMYWHDIRDARPVPDKLQIVSTLHPLIFLARRPE